MWASKRRLQFDLFGADVVDGERRSRTGSMKHRIWKRRIGTEQRWKKSSKKPTVTVFGCSLFHIVYVKKDTVVFLLPSCYAVRIHNYYYYFVVCILRSYYIQEFTLAVVLSEMLYIYYMLVYDTS